MLKRILIILLFFTIYLNGKTITIAAAANVIYSINDLKAEFNKEYPKIKVRVILGSSGKLTAQIKNGAPYQLFMSANMKYPNKLYKDGIAITKPPVYAQGTLAYLSKNRQDFSKKMDLLQDKKIKKIAIANPKIAPYGKATLEAIKNSGKYNLIKNKLIYAESASQTLSYTISAADIGFVAKSSLYSPKMKHFKKGINWDIVDENLYQPINQGVVLLKKGKNNKDVKAFYNFILGDKAKNIFKKFGYLVP